MVQRNEMVANLFAMHSDCTGVLFCLTGRWDQRGAGQKGLSSDLSGDERQSCLGKWLQPRTSLQITNRLKKSWHEKKYSKKGSKVSFIWFGLLVPPFKPKSKKGEKKNRLITFVIVQEKNSFVHIARGLSVIKMLLLDPGPDSAKVLLMWVILHCMNSLVGLLTWIKITSMTKSLQVQALHTGSRGCRCACVCVCVSAQRWVSFFLSKE